MKLTYKQNDRVLVDGRRPSTVVKPAVYIPGSTTLHCIVRGDGDDNVPWEVAVDRLSPISATSPLPWHTTPSTLHPAGTTSTRCDIVTNAAEFSPAFIAGDILPEDAELICTAVNCHTALLEAAQAWERARQDGGISHADLYEAAWRKTDAALALVKKGGK
jgi:hypothetical protein